MDEKDFKIFIDGKDGAEIRPHVDRLVPQGVKSYVENHAPADNSESLAERDATIKGLEIGAEVLRQCHKRGIDEDFITDLDITFNSIAEIDKKMEAIGAKFADMATQTANMATRKVNEILAGGFKPGASILSPDAPKKLENMDQDEINFLEEEGTLDSLIESQGL